MTPFIELSFMRCAVNSSRCVFDRCNEKQGLVCVPKKKRYEVLKIHRIYIPKRSKICKKHLNNGTWHDFISLEFKYTRDYIEDMVDLLRESLQNEPKEFPSEKFKEKTGLSLTQFDQLFNSLPTLHQYFPRHYKKARKALQMYLTRLHKGDRYNRVFSSFNISYKTGIAYISKARIALITDFVPKNIGFDALSRESLVESVSEMANNLYLSGKMNKAVIVADATYIFCNKTQNFDKQREFYNAQKKRHYFKPMVFVTTTGRFVEVFGPYKASENDATIMKNIFLSHGKQIEERLEHNDVFVLDRGFRDVKQYLERKGFIVKMPEFIEKNTIGQLTTIQANSSRMVTACRYVVETRNGHMKSIWQLFNRNWITYDLRHVMSDYRIGASLINKFYPTMESNKKDATAIAQSMIEKTNCSQNKFAVIIRGRVFANSVKKFVECEDLVFPKIAKNEFRLISLGNYQPSLALSYIHEQIKLKKKFVFFSFPDNLLRSVFKDLIDEYRIASPTVVLTIFQSRYRKNEKHYVYIMANQEVRGKDGIIFYFCDCQHGRRLVGCCAHVLAFIAYLGYYRFHSDEIKGKSEFIDDFFDDKQPKPPQV